MKKIRSKTARSVTISIIFSTLLVLSGMAAIASADEKIPTTSLFYGNAAVDGEYVESGTITAYINGESSGSSEIVSGHYHISVEGGTSDDVITFEINGHTADQTAAPKKGYKPRELDLLIGDQPAEDPPAQPSTGDNTPNGGTSGGYLPPATTPTGEDAQPVSGEIVTSAPTVTPAANATKKFAEKPDAKGLLPGFEAVFAIAGLLAVAYLIRRR
ncbi:MAG: PGF-CTERM sorting domain-containing protein [Euryarchaeota archaeon]|nr:PGF-CTERM sorting domain-containing protein [Euryarchaeota archaeon]